jgi:hypothetical protein
VSLFAGMEAAFIFAMAKGSFSADARDIGGGILAAVGMVDLLWLVNWNLYYDFVVHEDYGQAKSLHKDVDSQNRLVRGVAHAQIAPTVSSPKAFPYNGKIWKELREFINDPPELWMDSLRQHKCVGHAGDLNYGCHEHRSGPGNNSCTIEKTDKFTQEYVCGSVSYETQFDFFKLLEKTKY